VPRAGTPAGGIPVPTSGLPRVFATRAFAQGQHRPPNFGGTRVDVLDSARAIGAQIAAATRGIAPYEQIAHDPQQLRLDYERLRITWELTRDIGLGARSGHAAREES